MATASASIVPAAAAPSSTAAAANTHMATNGGLTGGLTGGSGGLRGPRGPGGPEQEGAGPSMTHKDNNNNNNNSNKDDGPSHYSGYNINGSSSSQQSDRNHPHANNAYPPPPQPHDHHYHNPHHSQQQQQQQQQHRQSFVESDARIQDNQQQELSRHEYQPHPRDPPYSHPHQHSQQQQQQHHSYNLHENAYGDPPSRQDRGGGDSSSSSNGSSNHVNGSSAGSNRPHYGGNDREYLQKRADRGGDPPPALYNKSNTSEAVSGQGRGSSSNSSGINGPNGVHTSYSNSNNNNNGSGSSSNNSNINSNNNNNNNSNNNSNSNSNHGRVHSAPHSFPSSHSSSSSFHSMNSNNNNSNNSNNNNASVSHHPNAVNRYPFSIPSISAKLDQPHHGDGSDALSSLWKKTTPIQEPYFQTRHTIASQHTLSTLGGILFSLDEVPSEFNQDMYIAMRNRIFELEAKSVNYSPFSHSRKRSFERNGLDDYPDRYAYGYDIDTGHYSKRPAHRYLPYGPPDQGPPPTHHRQSTSHPSWYTPEVYSSRPRYPPHHGRPPSDRERDHRHPGGGPYYDQDNGPGSLSGSRPGSPGLNHNNSALPPMRSAYSPPPASELSRQQPQSGQLPHSSHPHQAGPPPQDQRQQQQHLNSERPSGNMTHNGPYPPNSHPHPPPHHQSDHHPSTHPSHHPQHPHPHGPPHHHPLGPPQHQPPLQGYQQQQLQPIQPNGPTGAGHSQSMGAVTPEQRQSIHQQRHRAQQQAQSAHSRSYHLHKHMRLLDQQRAAQMAVQQQQHQQHAHEQQQQQQKYQQQKQQQGQSFKPIQRQYQPHQQMYPSYNQPIAIKPHPGPTQTQQQQLQKQQAQAQAQAQTTNIRPNPFQQQQQRLTPQQQMMQRYQQQRQLQQKQQQLRQLQYLRNRPAATYSTQKITATTTPSSALTGGSPGSHSPTPPRVFGPQVDRPIKKSTRPLECSNCMALDSLAWKPKVELQIVTPNGSNPSGESATAAAEGEVAQGAKLLCPACTQYLQTHGKARPVPPFRTNYLKKIHTRFKRELQEVRFQGWQDAQVLEIEDRMVEREFQMVFNGLDESDACQTQSRSNSVAASPAPAVPTASALAPTEPASTGSATDKDSAASTSFSSGAKEAAVAVSPSKIPERIVIKVEDDGEETVGSLKKSKLESVEVRTFQSEASVGELFGHRWRTEPVVGYTLVHFGGSDRTRMVPMNPTVPFLTVKFDRTTESITFAFRVLVNGLCLLSSGGGPPALHMPEMADDDESEEEEEIVVVPDNDKDDETSSPSASSPTEPVRSKRDVAPEGAATASMTTNNSNNNTATSESSSTSTSATAMEVDAAPK